MTDHQDVGAPYGIQGFPTIKIFGQDKTKPKDYNSQRSAQAIVDTLTQEITQTIKARAGGRGSSSSESGDGNKAGGNQVVELTDANFERLVLKSKEPWLIEFFAPWCGHCKNLEPHWKAAASELKGKVKLGAVDATVHQLYAGKFGVKGFPTIKYFAAGEKSIEDVLEYDGGRTT